MLAVKLHESKKPWLGKGSYLIPIFEWRSGRNHILRWAGLLTRHGWKLRYITLVNIPDDHPVFLASDWAETVGTNLIIGSLPVAPFSFIPDELKKEIMNDYDWLPELILGKPLPKSCIKWTKDIRLLYGWKQQK